MSATYGVLIHVVGGEDLTLEEVAVTGELIMDKVQIPRESSGAQKSMTSSLAEYV